MTDLGSAWPCSTVRARTSYIVVSPSRAAASRASHTVGRRFEHLGDEPLAPFALALEVCPVNGAAASS
jgi:hypothetical protein